MISEARLHKVLDTTSAPPHVDDESTSWPHWLGKEFPDVGVWSLGYAASPSDRIRWLSWFSERWSDAGHGMTLPDRALQLLDLMEQHGLGERPLFFICHSLGGLVAKQILRTASDASGERTKNIFAKPAPSCFLPRLMPEATLRP